MYQMRPPGIPMLPGYEYTDYTRTDFARRQHCEVKGGAFFVSQPRRPIPGRPTSKVEPPGAAPLGAHNAGAPGAPSARPPPLPLPERPPSAPPRSSAPAAGERPAPRRAPAFASAEPGVPGGWTPDEARDAREHLPASSLVPAPAWASDDSDAMLAFHAYFRETVSAGEPDAVERVRTCTLTFHVGDGTMQVYERPVENSGMPQGVLLKRHRVRSPRGGYYSLADLNVGVELDCYGRVYVLASCDAFTRAFLEAHGVRVGEELAVPKDPSALQSWPPGVVGGSRADDDDEITPPRPAEPSALQRFLQFDRIVLRYYLLWDEGIPTYLKRKLTMHYFLVDGTAEVFENKAELMAASRTTDILPLSVGRQRIPLKYETAGQAGFGPAKGVLYLAPKDILVGSHINVFGRRCFVYDADGATREWMAEREGVTLAPSLEKEVRAVAHRPRPRPRCGADRRLTTRPTRHLVRSRADACLPEEGAARVDADAAAHRLRLGGGLSQLSVWRSHAARAREARHVPPGAARARLARGGHEARRRPRAPLHGEARLGLRRRRVARVRRLLLPGRLHGASLRDALAQLWVHGWLIPRAVPRAAAAAAAGRPQAVRAAPLLHRRAHRPARPPARAGRGRSVRDALPRGARGRDPFRARGRGAAARGAGDGAAARARERG